MIKIILIRDDMSMSESTDRMNSGCVRQINTETEITFFEFHMYFFLHVVSELVSAVPLVWRAFVQ